MDIKATNEKLRFLTTVALLAAVICVLAPFSIPIGPVPISLATFAIYLVSALVPWKYGVSAVFLYIALGALGVPVFSGFSGGFQCLSGVTGGYIVGYIPCALTIGLLGGGRKIMCPVSMALGTLLCYALGTAWFMVATGNTLTGSLAVCVLPFIPFDALKIAAASAAAIPLRGLVGQFLRKRSAVNSL